MRIAVIAFEWPSDGERTGGVSHFNERLCGMLAERRHEVTAYTLQAKSKTSGYRISAMAGRWAKNRLLRYYLAPWCARRLDFAAYDLVLSSGDDWAMRRRGVPWIRIMHGSAWREMNSSRRFLRKANLCLLYLLEVWSSLRSDATLFNSADTRRLYPVRRADRIVHLPVDTRAFCPGPKESVPTLLFVGSLDGRKRGRWLLDLFVHRIRPALPAAKLWMVCEPDEAHDGVEYRSGPSVDELAALYRQAHVFCMPSTYEGYGIPYMEAMASGTLVVTTSNPGARELLKNGRFGWIVPDDELGPALLSALESPEHHGPWTIPAREWARLHDWEMLLPEFLGKGASEPDAPFAVKEGNG